MMSIPVTWTGAAISEVRGSLGAIQRARRLPTMSGTGCRRLREADIADEADGRIGSGISGTIVASTNDGEVGISSSDAELRPTPRHPACGARQSKEPARPGISLG
jgi:hypothetical protein